MHPAVASATGMYLTLYTTLAATIDLLISNRLNVPYAVLLGVMTIIGSIPGLYA